MSIALTLAISMTAAQLVGITRKLYSNKHGHYAPSHNIIVAMCSLVAALVLFFWNGCKLDISPFSLWLGIAFGVVTATSTVFNMKAMAIGPWSYTTVIISMSTLMSAVSGTLFWDEKITFLQCIGMALMVACILFSTELKGNNKKKSLKWILYCAAAFITCGGIGIMQKIHQTSPYKDELNGFLIVSFIFGIVFTSLSALWNVKNDPDRGYVKKLFSPMAIVWFLICGAGTAINHKLNLFLSGELPTAVFFPTVNGGGLVLTTICAMIMFKEKLTVKQWIGMICGVASVLLLCNYS